MTLPSVESISLAEAGEGYTCDSAHVGMMGMRTISEGDEEGIHVSNSHSHSGSREEGVTGTNSHSCVGIETNDNDNDTNATDASIGGAMMTVTTTETNNASRDWSVL